MFCKPLVCLLGCGFFLLLVVCLSRLADAMATEFSRALGGFFSISATPHPPPPPHSREAEIDSNFDSAFLSVL
jgi:hypothetical protein